jgi:quercetin dioxygenase-like cupin family protein
MQRLVILAALATLTAGPALADGYPAAPLLSTGTTVTGETVRYPTTGPAKVTAQIVTIQPGAATIVHRHGAPLFAYILEGEVTVDYGAKGSKVFKKGESFMEAMDVAHKGVNAGKVPVAILAVSMGAEGTENVLPEK